jgi:drug/metabolite transporter (DMT)-like permease
MVASSALITTMVIGIRFLSEGMHPFEIAFFRNCFGMAVLVPLVLRAGIAPLRTKRLGMLAVRGVLNAISLLLFFLAVTLVPVADIAAFSFTTPLFVTLLAGLFLGERLGFHRLAGLAVGFGGALVVLRPGAETINEGAIFALCSAAFWGTALAVTKGLSRTETSVTITFYGVMLLIPVTLVPALFVWTWPSWSQLAALAGLGAVWISAQLCMTQALRHADASLVVPFDFAKLIWGAAAGYLFFFEVPSIFTWIGSAMILGAATYMGWRERGKRRAAA